jgi:hypothetical protein
LLPVGLGNKLPEPADTESVVALEETFEARVVLALFAKS